MAWCPIVRRREGNICGPLWPDTESASVKRHWPEPTQNPRLSTDMAAEIISLEDGRHARDSAGDAVAWARYAKAMAALQQATAEARRAARLLVQSGAPKRGPDVIVEYAEPDLPGPVKEKA